MVRVDWTKVDDCPECGSSKVDIESEDAIKTNYYIYCLECKHSGPSSYGSWVDRATVAENAIKGWNKKEKW